MPLPFRLKAITIDDDDVAAYAGLLPPLRLHTYY